MGLNSSSWESSCRPLAKSSSLFFKMLPKFSKYTYQMVHHTNLSVNSQITITGYNKRAITLKRLYIIGMYTSRFWCCRIKMYTVTITVLMGQVPNPPNPPNPWTPLEHNQTGSYFKYCLFQYHELLNLCTTKSCVRQELNSYEPWPYINDLGWAISHTFKVIVNLKYDNDHQIFQSWKHRFSNWWKNYIFLSSDLYNFVVDEGTLWLIKVALLVKVQRFSDNN